MQNAPRAEVVAVAGVQRQEGLPGIVRLATSVDERLVASDDLAGVAADEPCGALVFGNAEKLRVTRQQRVREIGEAIPRHHVLIDCDATQKAESLLVAWRHDDRVAFARATEEIARENRCSSRRPTDDAATGEDVVKGLFGLRPGVGIDE